MGWREYYEGLHIKRWFYKQSLPLGFLVAIFVSMLWPQPGEHVAHYMVNGWKLATTINMSIIFFIFGITLDTSELVTAIKAVKAISFGMLSILVITPLFGFLAMLLPLVPYEFSLGLAIMACVPTSLSSGVTLVIQGYGNGALALLFTVASNVIGIVTAPLAVKLVLGSRVPNADVDALDLLVKLGVSILMPLLVGKAIRELIKPVRDNICKYKAHLYLLNNLQITLIVWQKLSAAREVLVEQEMGDVCLAGLAAIVEHFIFLMLNILVTWLLRYPEMERKAIIIMASQKNLPTAAVIISYFDQAAVGNLGLITIPCIVFYIMQLFIDAFIANTWSSKYERIQALENKYEEQLAALEHSDDGHGHADLAALAAAAAAATKLPDKLASHGSHGSHDDGAAGHGGNGLIGAGLLLQGGSPQKRGMARLARDSDDGEGDGMGLLQNVELNDVNPLVQRGEEEELR